MKKTVLREYARLIVRCGVNVRKGQDVLVYAGLLFSRYSWIPIPLFFLNKFLFNKNIH